MSRWKQIKTFVGIDNGVTGTIGIISDNGHWSIYSAFVKKDTEGLSTKRKIQRIDIGETVNLLSCFDPEKTQVWIEGPLVNPKRFLTTKSAIRAD